VILARQPEIAVDDQLPVAIADLAVRRRFIAMLEACEAAGRWCPPRLDDPPWAFDHDADRPVEPPMIAALRFDLEGWRGLSAELHGRAPAGRCRERFDHACPGVSVPATRQGGDAGRRV
jgi:hypothetical protein